MRPTLPQLLAVIGPVLVLGAGWSWADSLPPDNPTLQSVLDGTRGTAPAILLGNSVSIASVDEEALVKILGREVTHAGIGGALPPTWLALLRHSLYGKGRDLELVLTYAPAHNLCETAITESADVENLVDLAGSDSELLAYAGVTGPEGDRGLQAALIRTSGRARHRILRVLTELAMGLVGPRLGGDREAVDRMMGDPTPNDLRDRFTATPGRPTTQSPRRTQEEEQCGVGLPRLVDSALPALIAEAQAHRSRVVVIHAAVKPDSRPRCTGDGLGFEGDYWLTEQGVDVLDLTFAPLDGEMFSSEHHITTEGRAQLTVILGQALLALGPFAVDASAPGRRRVLGCEGQLRP